MKRPVRLANMEAIAVLNDKPASKAAILNLPGNRFGGGRWNRWVYLPSLAPLTDSPLGPFVVELMQIISYH